MCAVQQSFDQRRSFALKSQSLSPSSLGGFWNLGKITNQHQTHGPIVFSAIYKVMSMQAALTAICAAIAGLVGGFQEALSALLGGMVVLASSLAFGAAFFWRSARDQGNAGRALRTVLFAEALKWMTAIGGLLWLLRSLPFDTQAGPVVAGFVVALIGSWLALLTKT
jgi:F0F1-type ATP synthase assembly protein I